MSHLVALFYNKLGVVAVTVPDTPGIEHLEPNIKPRIGEVDRRLHIVEQNRRLHITEVER